MRFKNESKKLEGEFALLHPKCKEAASKLENFCLLNSMPQPIVTHILRTIPEQVEIYWKRIMMAEKLTEAEAKNKARAQWTWHFVFCAFDLRDWIYTPAQLRRIEDYLHTEFKTGDGWEILSHNVGSGHHLHVGFRDYSRHKEFLQSQKDAPK